MLTFWTMLRRQLGESRWLLGLSASALFGLGWLSAFIACRIERQFLRAVGADAERSMRFARGMGGAAMDFSSLSFQVMFWNHPFVLLIVCLWAISRAGAAVAGEIERGTLDLTLSRPVSRPAYLTSQIVAGLFGLVVLAAALVVGNRIGGTFNVVKEPPAALALIRPAVNLALVGLAVYGYALMFGARDVVRWRPNLFASVLTLAGFAAGVAASIPALSEWDWVGKLSIFKAFDPVEVAVKGETFARHASILGGLGLAGIVLAYLLFQFRDLPSNS